MAVKKMAEGVWRLTLPTPFRVGPIHTYLIKTTRLTLVDAGVWTDEAHQELQEGLRQLGYQLSDIDQVVLTHHHPDHIGLAGLFPDSTTIIGHERVSRWMNQEKDHIRNYEQFFQQLFRDGGIPEPLRLAVPSFQNYFRYVKPREVDLTIDAGDTIAGLEKWRVLYTPGHAQSHISLIRETDGLFIGGDVLLPHISSNAILEPPDHEGGRPPLTLLQYRDTLQRLLDEPFHCTLPGHGDPFNNGKALIKERLEKQEQRRDTVLGLLPASGMTAFEMGQVMFPKVFKKQLDLVMSEVYGFLKWLVVDGQVKEERSDRGVLFRPNEVMK